MEVEKFNLQKQGSLSHQVIKLGRLVNEVGLKNVREELSLPGLKQAHLDLFAHIDFSGTSISEIAHRKGVSKQAVSKMVSELVEMKVLLWQTDPEDARSKRVSFNTSGRHSIEKGFVVLLQIDERLKRCLGPRGYQQTLKSINQLVENFL